MRGAFESLPAVGATTRQRYLGRAREILEDVILDFDPGTSPYYRRVEPTTGRSYPYLIHVAGRPDYPIDADAGAGAHLEFIWEYGLLSGEWDYLAGMWSRIREIFTYLHLVNDWAYLASSCRDWGGCGSVADMFPSQWMGYLAYAEIAEVLGHDAERDEGLYLAARALLPLTHRFAFEPYAARYFPFDVPGETVGGFGECEPSSALSNANCGQLRTNLLGWDDYLLSGELIHPLVYDLYLAVVPGAFESVLLEGESLNGPGFNFRDGVYPENHVYAFSRLGKPSSWVEEKWAQVHTPVWSGEEIFGPPLSDRVAALMIHVGTRDIPIRLGSWAPAIVEDAVFRRADGSLTVSLRNDTGLPARFVVLTQETPARVSIDGAPTDDWSRDARWGTVTLPVAGPGDHTVVVDLGRQIPPAPAAGPPDPNLVVNGGFEDCLERPNYVRPWILAAKQGAAAAAEHEITHSGQSALKATLAATGSKLTMYQNVYFGPDRPYELIVWYNIPEPIPPGSFRVSTQEFQDRSDSPEWYETWTLPPEQNPSDGWQRLVVAKDHHDLPQAAICRILLEFANIGGTVYVDDVSLEVQGSATGVGSEGGRRPESGPGVLCARPNPFRGSVTLQWSGEPGVESRIEIFNAAGRRIRSEAIAPSSDNHGVYVWDGRDDSGRRMPAGLYLGRAGKPGHFRSLKLVRLD